MDNIRILIPTCATYGVALERLMNSLPIELYSRIVIVECNSTTDACSMNERYGCTHISTTVNAYEYTALGCIHQYDALIDSEYYVLLHDTCEATIHFPSHLQKLIEATKATSSMFMYASPNGAFNIGIAHVSALPIFAKHYTRNIDKREAWVMEVDKNHASSIDTILDKRVAYASEHTIYEKCSQPVYSNSVSRHVVKLPALELYKFPACNAFQSDPHFAHPNQL